VQALARHSLKGAASLTDFEHAFTGRLVALSRTQSLLTTTEWKEADLYELLRLELVPYGIDRSVLSGPRIALTAQLALPFGMVIHELATNAAKHGALTAAGGTITVNWQHQDESLKFRWVEERPDVTLRGLTGRGFGSTLLNRTIRSQMGGEYRQEWKPRGLTFELVVPLHEVDA
jgi:two-component sensor histidine kinase